MENVTAGGFETTNATPFDGPKEYTSERVPIHFSEKLVNNFVGKNGKDYTAIKIPPKEENGLWGQIVVPSDRVYMDKNGHGLYTYLNADAEFTVQFNRVSSVDPVTQEKQYVTETEKMTGRDIADTFSPSHEKEKYISISFPTKFVGQPFVSNEGKNLISVSVPPVAGSNKWSSFVVPENRVHENEGKASSYISFKEGAQVSLRTAGDRIGEDLETGKPQYAEATFEMVSVVALKSRFDQAKEQYQQKSQTNSYAEKFMADYDRSVQSNQRNNDVTR